MSTKRRDLIGTPSPPPKERKPLNGLTANGNLARPKTGGRQAGTPNKLEISAAMTDDILAVYASLGGPRWLLAWARKNESEFVKQVLSRLFPTPPRDPLVEIQQNNLTVSDMSDREAAIRIAYILNSGAHEVGLPPMVDRCCSPIAPPPEDAKRPPPRLDLDYPPPRYTEDELVELARKQQVSDLVRDTRGANSDYGGSALEQGFHRRRNLF